MVLNRRPERQAVRARQRGGRGPRGCSAGGDPATERGTAGGTAPATEGCCGAGGDFGARMDRPGCALLLCKCRYHRFVAMQ